MQMMPRAYRRSALRLRFLSSSPVQSTVVPRAGDDFLKRKKLFENVNA